MNWYHYHQNNSGGHFFVDNCVCHNVFIEAPDLYSADAEAELHGIYFNGVEKGYDCECCGDRWYGANHVDKFHVFEWKGGKAAMIEYSDLRSFFQAQADAEWSAHVGEMSAIAYFADGTVERFYKTKEGF